MGEAIQGGAATPDPAELVRRARAMIPVLRRRGPAGDSARRLPEETIAEMQAAGFFRILQPRRWGGYEMHPSVFFDVQAALAEGDMSTAWVYGVVGVHPWLLALLDDRAARDVWDEDDTALICSPLAPNGKAIAEGDGFRFSGHWRYSSGSAHCDWAFLGGEVQGAGAAPERRLFLVPRRDFRLVDTWDVAGLRGTGSNDILVESAFVPAYRTQRWIDNFNCAGAGQAANPSPLYRMPFGQIFFRGVAIPAVGALRGMLAAFLDWGGARLTTYGARTAEDPDARLVCAEAAAACDEIMVVLHHSLANLMAYAERHEVPPLSERLQYRFQSAALVERCNQLALRLFRATGGAGLARELPFARFMADIGGARQHVANQVEPIGRNWGALLLKGEPRPDLMI